MSITSITKTLSSDDLDALSEGELLALLDLQNEWPDVGVSIWWKDLAGQTWEFPCYLLNVGTRAVLWSETDEAGIADVTVSDDAYDGEEDQLAQLREFAVNIASGLGTLIGDGQACPDCGRDIEWGGIETVQREANRASGQCGCSGRTWMRTERGPGNDWAVSHD